MCLKKFLSISLVIFITLFAFTTNSYATEDDDTPRADFMVIEHTSCGDGLVKNIPTIVPRIAASSYNVVMVVVPAILVILGAIDLAKGVMSQKEDEIKKGRDSLIKRLVAGMAVFLIVMLVKLLVGVVAQSSDDANGIIGCIDCFMSNNCD